MLETTDLLLEWPEECAFSKAELWQQIDERTFRSSLADLRTFKWLEERGYSDVFLTRYPGLRKYFTVFLHLPFAVEQGNDSLLHALDIIRQLNAGTLKRVSPRVPNGLCSPRAATRPQGSDRSDQPQYLGGGLGLDDQVRPSVGLQRKLAGSQATD